MQPIYTQTVGVGGANSVSFNNIPQTFTDLKLVISGRMNSSYTAVEFYILPNTNTNAIYSSTWLYGYATGSLSASRQSNVTYTPTQNATAANATASTFGNAEIYFPNYTGSNFKSYIADSVSLTNGTAGNNQMAAGLVRDTNPITSLYIPATGSWVQYSTFTLYGITKG